MNTLRLTIADMRGTYIASVRPGATERHHRPEHRMIAAVIEDDGDDDGDGGPWYLRVLGPEATVAKWETSVEAFLSSLEGAPIDAAAMVASSTFIFCRADRFRLPPLRTQATLLPAAGRMASVSKAATVEAAAPSATSLHLSIIHGMAAKISFSATVTMSSTNALQISKL